MKTKMLALFAVLVLSVALAGTAYAAWTTQIFFDGTVETGNVSVIIEGISEDNPELFPWIVGDRFTILVRNAYPGWSGSFDVTVKNTGSLPVTIGTLSLSETTSSTLDDFLNIETSTIPTTAIAPGDSLTVTVTFSIDDVPDVPQSASATYAGSVTFVGP